MADVVPKDTNTAPPRRVWFRFDRNEWAGSFGDIGTDLPLIVAMIPAAGLDCASVFVMFGLMQILTGIVYGLPMPMQPLKAMAVLVITQHLSADVLYGGGLVIGVVMALLTLTGALDWLVRTIPRPVVRGVQFGLGLKLAGLALGDYVPAMGASGYVLALGGFCVVVFFWGNRRVPAALLLVAAGVVYALFNDFDLAAITSGIGFTLPTPQMPKLDAILTGALVLALPQLPLSVSNSIIATDRTLHDLFPDVPVGVRKIGTTYSIANLLNPFFGGLPVCHGCGGLVGHYTFGARTGGSVVMYGSMFLLVGLFFSGAADHVVRLFPLPLLGVLLLFEALMLLRFVADVAKNPSDLTVALLVGLMAAGLPQGFLIGLVVGWVLCIVQRYRGRLFDTHP